MITDIHGEDRLVQATFTDHLRDVLGWESIYAHNEETFGPNGTLGRANEREAVLARNLTVAVDRLNVDLPQSARQQAVEKLTRVDFSRSLIQQNKDFHDFIRPSSSSRFNARSHFSAPRPVSVRHFAPWARNAASQIGMVTARNLPACVPCDTPRI